MRAVRISNRKIRDLWISPQRHDQSRIMDTHQSNGRDPNGRFARGNPGGPGNPHAGQVAKLRAAILRAVYEGDIETIIAKLVEQAREGDLAAAREVLDRTIGKASQSDLLARIEALETIAVGLSEDRA